MWIQHKLKINKLSLLNISMIGLFLILLIDFVPDQHLDIVAFLLHVVHHAHSLPIMQNNAFAKNLLALTLLINHSAISLYSHAVISKALIFAIAIYILSIGVILEDIINKKIFARTSSVPKLTSFKSYQEAIKAFENLP